MRQIAVRSRVRVETPRDREEVAVVGGPEPNRRGVRSRAVGSQHRPLVAISQFHDGEFKSRCVGTAELDFHRLLGAGVHLHGVEHEPQRVFVGEGRAGIVVRKVGAARRLDSGFD